MTFIEPYEPLPDYLSIGKSQIHGLGVITNKAIDKLVVLGISHIKNSDYKDGLIRTPLGGFINHSDKPNCKYAENTKTLSLVTTRKINKGEELTVSYRGWYDDKILDEYN